MSEIRPDFRPIGLVASPVTEPVDEGWGEVVSEVRLDEAYAPGLQGLDAFSHAIVVTWLHLADFDPAEDPIDVFRLDRDYWRSLWYKPGQSKNYR